MYCPFRLVDYHLDDCYAYLAFLKNQQAKGNVFDDSSPINQRRCSLQSLTIRGMTADNRDIFVDVVGVPTTFAVGLPPIHEKIVPYPTDRPVTKELEDERGRIAAEVWIDAIDDVLDAIFKHCNVTASEQKWIETELLPGYEIYEYKGAEQMAFVRFRCPLPGVIHRMHQRLTSFKITLPPPSYDQPHFLETYETDYLTEQRVMMETFGTTVGWLTFLFNKNEIQKIRGRIVEGESTCPLHIRIPFENFTTFMRKLSEEEVAQLPPGSGEISVLSEDIELYTPQYPLLNIKPSPELAGSHITSIGTSRMQGNNFMNNVFYFSPRKLTMPGEIIDLLQRSERICKNRSVELELVEKFSLLDVKQPKDENDDDDDDDDEVYESEDDNIDDDDDNTELETILKDDFESEKRDDTMRWLYNYCSDSKFFMEDFRLRAELGELVFAIPCLTGTAKVRIFYSEPEMLTDYCYHRGQANPVFFSGYRSTYFDMNAIAQRCKRHGILDKFLCCPSVPWVVYKRYPPPKSAEIPKGMVEVNKENNAVQKNNKIYPAWERHLDFYDFAQEMYGNLPDYKLETVSQHALQIGKIETDFRVMFLDWWRCVDDYKTDQFAYVIRDAELVNLLARKMNTFLTIYSTAELTHNVPRILVDCMQQAILAGKFSVMCARRSQMVNTRIRDFQSFKSIEIAVADAKKAESKYRILNHDELCDEKILSLLKGNPNETFAEQTQRLRTLSPSGAQVLINPYNRPSWEIARLVEATADNPPTKGGLVQNTLLGVHENVDTGDVGSMYPSIIEIIHSSPDALVIQKKYRNLPGVEYHTCVIDPSIETNFIRYEFCFARIKHALYVEATTELKNARKKCKELMKKAEEQYIQECSTYKTKFPTLLRQNERDDDALRFEDLLEKMKNIQFYATGLKQLEEARAEFNNLPNLSEDFSALFEAITNAYSKYLYYDVMQLSIKRVGNAMYGFATVSKGMGRYPCSPIGMSITATGRKIISETKTSFMENGFIIVYGDTDSVLVKYGFTDCLSKMKRYQDYPAYCNFLDQVIRKHGRQVLTDEQERELKRRYHEGQFPTEQEVWTVSHERMTKMCEEIGRRFHIIFEFEKRFGVYVVLRRKMYQGLKFGPEVLIVPSKEILKNWPISCSGGRGGKRRDVSQFVRSVLLCCYRTTFLMSIIAILRVLFRAMMELWVENRIPLLQMCITQTIKREYFVPEGKYVPPNRCYDFQKLPAHALVALRGYRINPSTAKSVGERITYYPRFSDNPKIMTDKKSDRLISYEEGVQGMQGVAKDVNPYLPDIFDGLISEATHLLHNIDEGETQTHDLWEMRVLRFKEWLQKKHLGKDISIKRYAAKYFELWDAWKAAEKTTNVEKQKVSLAEFETFEYAFMDFLGLLALAKHTDAQKSSRARSSGQKRERTAVEDIEIKKMKEEAAEYSKYVESVNAEEEKEEPPQKKSRNK